MTGLPEIRDAIPSEIEDMLDVIETAFPHWPPVPTEATALEYLRWKLAGPTAIDTKHTVAALDGRIVATRLRWENRIELDGRKYILETGADFAVHPDYQGRGISRLVREHFHDRLIAHPRPGISMLSNAPQVRYMTGDTLVGRPITVWTRPFGPRTVASAGRTAGLAEAWRVVRARLRQGRAAAPRIEVLDTFDARFDGLWDRAHSAFDIIPSRRLDYLEWRFARPASGTAEILALIEAEQLLAYAIVKHRGEEAHLVDLVWDPARPDALAAVVSAAVRKARSADATLLTSWLPTGHVAEPTLRGAGFLATGRDEVLLGNGDGGETSEEVLELFTDQSRTMHVTMSDFDYF